MLFHVGALWRLVDTGLLGRLDRISSVSGGSITAGYLGLKWSRLQGVTAAEQVNGFRSEVVAGLRALASKTIDWKSVVRGALIPWSSVGEQVARFYDCALFDGATLQDLPDRPRFVVNASNLQSGALWRFSKPYMRDWKVGKIASPRLPLALAVAASSAFPPFLSPVRLRLSASDFEASSGDGLQTPQYTTRVRLSDGGVYDNLGLEPVFKRYYTVLVSDGGMAFKAVPRPAASWACQMYRVLNCIDNQVRALRKQEVIEAFLVRQDALRRGLPENHPLVRVCGRRGSYWGIATPASTYPEKRGLSCPADATRALAAVCTRLKAMDEELQERLINWGYAACDYSLRSYFDAALPVPAGFPYARGV